MLKFFKAVITTIIVVALTVTDTAPAQAMLSVPTPAETTVPFPEELRGLIRETITSDNVPDEVAVGAALPIFQICAPVCRAAALYVARKVVEEYGDDYYRAQKEYAESDNYGWEDSIAAFVNALGYARDARAAAIDRRFD